MKYTDEGGCVLALNGDDDGGSGGGDDGGGRMMVTHSAEKLGEKSDFSASIIAASSGAVIKACKRKKNCWRHRTRARVYDPKRERLYLVISSACRR